LGRGKTPKRGVRSTVYIEVTRRKLAVLGSLAFIALIIASAAYSTGTLPGEVVLTVNHTTTHTVTTAATTETIRLESVLTINSTFTVTVTVTSYNATCTVNHGGQACR
jgi:hypothetical protein